MTGTQHGHLTSGEDTFEARFFSGDELFGNSFTQEEIDLWFEDEQEAFADLLGEYGSELQQPGMYLYHAANDFHGFSTLPAGRRFRALGLGSAYGDEFLPLADRLDSLTIIEPSDELTVDKIGSVTPNYIKPSADGRINAEDASVDLILCFGTLHHIPNVETVVRELGRVLAPGGFLLVREPSVSMGDWREPRPYLTKRERGIPPRILVDFIEQAGLTVIRERHIMFGPTNKVSIKLHIEAPYNRRWLVALDGLAATITRPLWRYHATKWWERFRPTSVFIVATRR